MARRELIARGSLGVLAILAIAWLGLMLRDVRLRARAEAGPRGGINGLIAELRRPAALRRRIDALRRSRLLDPDTAPLLQIAFDLQLHGGASAMVQARRTAAGVTRQEPQNLNAWIVLAKIDSQLDDTAGAARARAQILRLDPRIR